MKDNSNIPLRNWIENFDNGVYASPDIDTQREAGWNDWFCKASALRNKTYSLAPKVKRIANSAKINQNTMYVFFKNNCPLHGSLYDDFRICDIETGKVIFTITPRSEHKGGCASVYGSENNFESPLYEGSMAGIYEWFGV